MIRIVLIQLLLVNCLYAQDNLKAGLKMMDDGDYFGAVYEFGQHINKNPDAAIAYVYRAKAKIQLKDFSSALSDTKKSIEIDKSLVEGYNVLGDILIFQREYESAINAFDEALQLEPTNDFATNKKAFILFATGDIKSAENLLESGIGNNPAYGPYYFTQGLINSSEGRLKKAIDDFDQALNNSKGEDDYGIFVNKGITYMKLEYYDLSLASFNSAVELQPDNASAYQGRGRVFYLEGSFQQAVEDFERALSISENNPIAYYNLGMSYLKLEDLSKACLNFQKSCKLGNKNACKKIFFECTDQIDIL